MFTNDPRKTYSMRAAGRRVTSAIGIAVGRLKPEQLRRWLLTLRPLLLLIADQAEGSDVGAVAHVAAYVVDALVSVLPTARSRPPSRR
ncbi:MAG: hypothetical protein JWP11_3679 [Frankiales bacterium]|nr:hypothetical protein [Frankiales bacterium]